MKYIKKPVIIEAFRWTGDQDQIEDPDWICEAIKQGVATLEYRGTENCSMLIKTPTETHRAIRGDYIIKGIKGELYPCHPGLFEQMYEEKK